VSFENLLRELLPQDLPHRDACITKSARHLEMIVETNQQFNLTPIVEEREAVIKHVVDSLLPWRLFAGVRRIADAGTGPGFPGIPLAIAFPATTFTLIEFCRPALNADLAQVWCKLTMRVQAVCERAVTRYCRARTSPFECFQLVDLAFHLTVAPGHCYRILDIFSIPPEHLDETLQPCEAGVLDILHPLL